MREITDAELTKRSAGGDREAFVELVCRYKGSLAALIRRLVDDPDEAEDLLQETLVHSWLRVGSVRDPERVHAWLLQVARNQCRDYHKSAQRRACPTESEQLELHVNRYGRAGAGGQLAEELGEALESLPGAEQEVIELFYARGLTIREICAQTQAPAGTVKSRLFTARHHLRSLLSVGEDKGDTR